MIKHHYEIVMQSNDEMTPQLRIQFSKIESKSDKKRRIHYDKKESSTAAKMSSHADITISFLSASNQSTEFMFIIICLPSLPIS